MVDRLVAVDDGDYRLPEPVLSATVNSLDMRYARVLTPEQFGAVGDGSADDRPAFVNLIAAMTEGVVVQCRAGAVYRISDGLTVSGLKGWKWRGGDIRFTKDAASSSGNGGKAFSIVGCSDVAIEGMRLEQTVQAGNRQYNGLDIHDSKDVLVSDCTVYNFRWVGIGVGGTSENVTIRDCQGLRCYVGGYGATGPTGIKFLGGRYSSEWSKTQEFVTKGGVWDASSWYYDGIIIGGGAWVIDGVVLDDNGQSGLYGGDGITSGTVSNCVVFGNWNKGIDFGTTAGGILDKVTIVGNQVSGSKTGDINLAGATNCIVSGNVVNTTAPTASIALNGVSKLNLIVGNTITSTAAATYPALFVDSVTAATENVIVANLITAAKRYSINTGVNIFFDTEAGISSSKSALHINRLDQTGFHGRLMLALYASADNSIAQIITNKPVEITDSGGARMGINVGVIDASGTIRASGAVRPQQVATGSRPTPAAAGVGAMIYDTTLSKPIWSTGSAWKDAAGTTV
ncbi:NosD domain-containing protein [Microbacterium oxydans]|uniref:NosD domain-containing protein n=1 Tax=Microbacterium oxydans TaxID=82380 RepID=UPI0037CC6906